MKAKGRSGSRRFSAKFKWTRPTKLLKIVGWSATAVMAAAALAMFVL